MGTLLNQVYTLANTAGDPKHPAYGASCIMIVTLRQPCQNYVF
mgnify:FL=1